MYAEKGESVSLVMEKKRRRKTPPLLRRGRLASGFRKGGKKTSTELVGSTPHKGRED